MKCICCKKEVNELNVLGVCRECHIRIDKEATEQYEMKHGRKPIKSDKDMMNVFSKSSEFDIDKIIDDFLKEMFTVDKELESVEKSIKKATPCYECREYKEHEPCAVCSKELDNIKINKRNDIINNPSHYTHGKIEPIKVISDWKLNFNLGNALKYIARCEHKGNKKQDIQKAIKYLQFELEKYDR